MGISISNATSSAITKYSVSLRSGEPVLLVPYHQTTILRTQRPSLYKMTTALNCG